MCQSLISFNQIRASLMNLSEKQGRIARAIVFIILFALFSTASQSAMASSRIALVIGNSKYEKVGRLENTINDAKLIEGKLASMGFKTQLLLDATESKLKRAVREFANDSEQSEIGLVFYAGHGVQVSGENFLLPIDMEPPRRESDVPLLAINVNDILKSINSRVKVLILDACRDNPVISRSLKGSRGGATRGLAAPQQTETTQSGGVFIAYATESGDVASDGRGSNSPFTTALAEHISKPISIDDMFSLVTRDVRRLTNNAQRPFKYASMESVVCLSGPCSDLTFGIHALKESDTPLPIEQDARESKKIFPDASEFISSANPHQIYRFVMLSPNHPERRALVRRLRSLSATYYSSQVMMDSLVNNNQLWFYSPKSYKQLGDDRVTLVLSTQEIKKFLIFSTSTDRALGLVFDCEKKMVGTYLNGDLNQAGEVENITFRADPLTLPLAPIPAGSVLDHAWENACSPNGLLPILPLESSGPEGWELTAKSPEGSQYVNRSASFGDGMFGESYLRLVYSTPRVFEPSTIQYTQLIYRYRYDCVKKLVSIDAEYISDSGKVVGKTTAYGEKPWNDILPGGAAALTYPFACGKALN